jgi:hypothetical protein
MAGKSLKSVFKGKRGKKSRIYGGSHINTPVLFKEFLNNLNKRIRRVIHILKRSDINHTYKGNFDFIFLIELILDNNIIVNATLVRDGLDVLDKDEPLIESEGDKTLEELINDNTKQEHDKLTLYENLQNLGYYLESKSYFISANDKQRLTQNLTLLKTVAEAAQAAKQSEALKSPAEPAVVAAAVEPAGEGASQGTKIGGYKKSRKSRKSKKSKSKKVKKVKKSKARR